MFLAKPRICGPEGLHSLQTVMDVLQNSIYRFIWNCKNTSALALLGVLSWSHSMNVHSSEFFAKARFIFALSSL